MKGRAVSLCGADIAGNGRRSRKRGFRGLNGSLVSISRLTIVSNKGYLLRVENIHPFLSQGCSVAGRPGCGLLSSCGRGGTFSVRGFLSAQVPVHPKRLCHGCRIATRSLRPRAAWHYSYLSGRCTLTNFYFIAQGKNLF